MSRHRFTVRRAILYGKGTPSHLINFESFCHCSSHFVSPTMGLTPLCKDGLKVATTKGNRSLFVWEQFVRPTLICYVPFFCSDVTVLKRLYDF